MALFLLCVGYVLKTTAGFSSCNSIQMDCLQMLEFGDEDIESEYTHPSSRNHMNGKASVNGRHRESTGFMVRDAPWDPANSSDFPALDDSPQGAPRNSWPVRGSRH